MIRKTRPSHKKSVAADTMAGISQFCLNTIHYHLQVQANPKKCTKNPMLFLASMGEMGLTHDIFFEFSLGPFEGTEVE